MQTTNRRPLNQASVTIVLTVALILLQPMTIGQEPSSEDEKISTSDEILRLYEKAKEAGEQVPKDVYEWVKQELQSIGDWEYLVIEIDSADAKGLEGSLNEQGADRWECIWVAAIGDKTRLIMKRPGKSYLKHIPLSQLLKLVLTGDSSANEN